MCVRHLAEFSAVDISKLLRWHKLALTASMPRFAKACGVEALMRITTVERSNWATYRDVCDVSIMQALCNFHLSRECTQRMADICYAISKKSNSYRHGIYHPSHFSSEVENSAAVSISREDAEKWLETPTRIPLP
jgi:hypothetical protein